MHSARNFTCAHRCTRFSCARRSSCYFRTVPRSDSVLPVRAPPIKLHSKSPGPVTLLYVPTACGRMCPGGNTAQQVACMPAIRVGVPWHELLSGHFHVAYMVAGLQYKYTGNDVPARPPLSRWGCSAKLAGVWLCSGLLFVAAWFGLLLLARVALPRSCELRGMSEEEARHSCSSRSGSTTSRSSRIRRIRSSRSSRGEVVEVVEVAEVVEVVEVA